jgi:hypothetical protein
LIYVYRVCVVCGRASQNQFFFAVSGKGGLPDNRYGCSSVFNTPYLWERISHDLSGFWFFFSSEFTQKKNSKILNYTWNLFSRSIRINFFYLFLYTFLRLLFVKQNHKISCVSFGVICVPRLLRLFLFLSFFFAFYFFFFHWVGYPCVVWCVLCWFWPKVERSIKFQLRQ